MCSKKFLSSTSTFLSFDKYFSLKVSTYFSSLIGVFEFYCCTWSGYPLTLIVDPLLSRCFYRNAFNYGSNPKVKESFLKFIIYIFFFNIIFITFVYIYLYKFQMKKPYYHLLFKGLIRKNINL